MEYTDYDNTLWTTGNWIDRFLHGRGKQATFSSSHSGLLSNRFVHQVDEYYELPAFKRKLFWQSPFDNLTTNFLRVGLLGFLERMVCQMTLLSPSKLKVFSPRQLMNSLSSGNGMYFGLYRGNGIGMLQFAFAHALPASLSQTIDPDTNTVVISPLKYLGLSFLFNLLAMPLQITKLSLFNNMNWRSLFCPQKLNSSVLRAHVTYSATNSLFIGSLAYIYSKDWSPSSLLLLPLSLGLYLGSLQSYVDFQNSFKLKTERFNSIVRSNLGRGMFSVLLLANLTVGFRYFGMASHDRIKKDYIEEHEAKGMFKGYALRTKQFTMIEGYNRLK